MCLSITLPNVTTTVIKNTQVISSVHLVCLSLEAEPAIKQAAYNKSPCRHSSRLNLMRNLELRPHEKIQFCYIKARIHRFHTYLKQVSMVLFLLKNFLIHSAVNWHYLMQIS